MLFRVVDAGVQEQCDIDSIGQRGHRDVRDLVVGSGVDPQGIVNKLCVSLAGNAAGGTGEEEPNDVHASSAPADTAGLRGRPGPDSVPGRG